jgi:hypothetical protein
MGATGSCGRRQHDVQRPARQTWTLCTDRGATPARVRRHCLGDGSAQPLCWLANLQVGSERRSKVIESSTGSYAAPKHTQGGGVARSVPSPPLPCAGARKAAGSHSLQAFSRLSHPPRRRTEQASRSRSRKIRGRPRLIRAVLMVARENQYAYDEFFSGTLQLSRGRSWDLLLGDNCPSSAQTSPVGLGRSSWVGIPVSEVWLAAGWDQQQAPRTRRRRS